MANDQALLAQRRVEYVDRNRVAADADQGSPSVENLHWSVCALVVLGAVALVCSLGLGAGTGVDDHDKELFAI